MSATGHFADELSAYLDGELAPEERAAVDAHLGECAACAQRLEELASVDSFSRTLNAAAPEGYFEAFPGRVRQRLAARRVRRLPAWTWAAAAAVLLAVITPLTVRMQRDPAPADARIEPVTEDSLRRAQVAGPSAAAPSSAPAATLPAEQEERLRALGYIGGEGARQARAPREIKEKQDAAVAARLRERDADAGSHANAVVGGVTGGAAPRDAELKDGRLKKETFAEGAGADQSAQYLPAPAAPPPAATPPPSTLSAFDSAVRSREAAKRADETGAKTRAEPAAAPPAPAEAPAAQADAAKPSSAQAEMQAARREGRLTYGLSDAVAREFAALVSLPVRTAEEARAAARRWQELAERHRNTPEADEARVRAIEAMATAFRLERQEADRDRARKAAGAYLAGTGAHKDRVRALVQALER